MPKKCSYPECDRPHRSRGYCNGHYTQLLRGRDLTPLTYKREEQSDTCRRSYCDQPTKSKNLCARHENRQYTWKRAGIVDGTWERFDELWEDQDGKCGACEKALDITSRYTHLDHDHETGLARGVLCHNCNQGIGSFREDTSAMLGAIRYLTSSGES